MAGTRHKFPSKLTLDDATRIRARYAQGASVRTLTADYGVSPASIYAVLRHRAHRCVVAVELAPLAFARLTEAARDAGRERAEFAAELVTRALARS